MRAPILPLLLLISLGVDGQEFVNPFGKHTAEGVLTVGLTGSALNYPGSVNTGISLGMMFDFLKTRDASISFGTNIKAGMENEDGTGLLVVAGNVFANLYASGSYPGWVSNSGNVGYCELPLLVHYNFGLGATTETKKRFGFYLGGGMTYVVTGYPGETGNAESISFYGLEADAGIRLFRHFQIGFSGVFSLRDPLGPITQRPGMFGVTLSGCLIGKNK